MVDFYYKKIIKKLNNSSKKLLLIGLTYKENVPDFRNSLSLKLFYKLNKKNKNIYAYDPYIKNLDKKNRNILKTINNVNKFNYVVHLVKHRLTEKLFKKNKNVEVINLNVL